MSSVAFGALATRRENSDSGTSKSEQPPGLNSYIDVLAALVPAEVLAINALIITTVTRASPQGQARITDPGTLRLAFWLLIGLSMALFVLGRQPTPTSATVRQQSGVPVPRWQRLEWQDLIRVLIPPAAFVGWTMLEPTSVWNAVVPRMSSGSRTLIAIVGAAVLAAVTKALVSHSDNKPSPPQLSERSVLKQAAQRAIEQRDRLAGQLQRTQEQTVAAAQQASPPDDLTQPTERLREPAPETVPVATPPVANGGDAEHEPPVPKWVY